MISANVMGPIRQRMRRVLLVGGLVVATAAVPVVAHAQDHAGAPGTVRLTGAILIPREMTRAQLAALPQKTLKVTYQTEHGPETRTESGPLLADVLPTTALKPTTAKNGQLTFVMLAVGSGGYGAALAYGEIAPHITNQMVILALSQDGKPLDQPRLIVPADVGGGRDVRDLKEIRVVQLTA